MTGFHLSSMSLLLAKLRLFAPTLASAVLSERWPVMNVPTLFTTSPSGWNLRSRWEYDQCRLVHHNLDTSITCLGSPPSRFPPRGCLCRWWPMQRWCCWQLPRHDEAHSPELHCRHCHWAALYELLCSYNCCPLNWIFWIYQIFHVILSMSFTCQLIINTLVTHFG